MKELKLFKKAIRVGYNNPERISTINELAIKKGYLVHPNCNLNSVEDFLNTLPNNINTTFYKEWSNITNKSRSELLIDQIIHYHSTYGSNFQAQAYVPNGTPTVVGYNDIKVIMPITIDELEEKVQKMLYSGIALKEETVTDLIELINLHNLFMDIDLIKNKEAMMHFCKQLGKYPTDPVEMVRFLVFLYTEQTLLIKSPEVLFKIKANHQDITQHINNYGLKKLSSVFYRFKVLFLAMKKHNSIVINKLRRLAKKNHKPMKNNLWQNVLNASNSELNQITDKQIDQLSNFKKLSLMQAIKTRSKKTGIVPVKVRNGKLFIKEKEQNYDAYTHTNFLDRLKNSVIESLSNKACRIKLPTNINLVAPTSEKTFVGHIPYGSYVNMNDNAIVGINWKNEDGARDLDLSMVNIKGKKIGWNTNYESDGVLYSGDMTNADPEATELLYCKTGMPDGIVMVNAYSAEPNSRYNMFLATDSIVPKMNHMVDPNAINFMTQLEITGEDTIGMFVNNKFVFMNLTTSSRRVSNGNVHVYNFLNHIHKTIDTYIYLSDLLIKAGFEIVEDNADIDLSLTDKSILIDLFS